MRLMTSFLAAAALLAPLALPGQQWRTIESARQLADSQPLKVSLTYGAGKLEVAPSEDHGLLYQMRIRYDEQSMDAVHEYDASQHRLQLGLDRANVGWKTLRTAKGERGGSMSVELSPAVPMDLDVSVGGAEATLELGGLKVRSLKMQSGMAGAKVSFDDPNLVPMDRMTIEVGMGGIALSGLGNANVGEIAVHGAMGGVELDFGESVMRDVKIDAAFALGGLQVAVPADVGVMFQGDLKAAKFDRGIGFTRMGDAWYSMNWKDTSHHITIVGSSTLSSVRVQLSGQ
jgi:hypothetical protein